MEDIKVLYSEDEVERRIKEIGNEITNKYRDEDVVLICILKGAVVFFAELAKHINNKNLKFDFMKVGSYGSRTESTDEITFSLDISSDIKGKHVIIVEDIIDSGYSLDYVKKCLSLKEPDSIEICVLLDKESRRKVNVQVDYTGFVIDDLFVIGYGMDYDEKYRNLPYIGYIEK